MEKSFDNAKEISIELNGKKFTGRYIVKNHIITVISGFGERSTQVGGSSPENLARIILGELVKENGNL